MDQRGQLIVDFLRRVTTGSLESAQEGVAASKEAFLQSSRSATSNEMEAALEGWQRVEAGRDIARKELDALEAIVLPTYRPVINIINDSFAEAPQPWELLNGFKPQIEAAARAIGRVEISGHPWLPYAGTGFVVGPNLIMTNRHVAELFILGLGLKHLAFYPGRASALDFKQEVIPSGRVLIEVRAARLVHPYWDAAILEVAGLSGHQPLRLATAEPASLIGRRVVAIGYPMLDSRNDEALQHRIFQGVYGRKRLQPGTIMGYGKIKSFDHVVEALAHDCSTLGGNSGSAIVDLETGQVLGLHFGGIYLKANFAVPAWELARDRKLVDLGLEFATSTAATAATVEPEWLGYWKNVEAEATHTEQLPTVTHAASDKFLRVGADWYERASDAEIAHALKKDPEGTRALLRQTLRTEEAVEIVEDLGDEAAQEGIFGVSPDPDLPEIILLHGIMGGHLAHLGWLKSRVWLFPPAFFLGSLATKLSLADDGLRDAQGGQNLQPDGLLKLTYGRPTRRWRRQGFVVHQFSFDWRKSITQSADRLHHFIENLHIDRPAKMFVLVAHSMGGLVASMYAQRHTEWSDRVQRAILMGSPLGGSYAPVEAIIGSYPLLRKMAFISRKVDLEDLRRMARTLPGLLDMLPNPKLFPDAEQMYRQQSWPDEIAPPQRWLDQSRNLKPLLIQSPLMERTTHLVSLKHGTVSSVVEREGGGIWRGERNGVGDGTVPGKAAVIEGVPAFQVDYDHSRIPRDPKAIQAVSDLIKQGACALDRVRPEDISDAIRFEELPIMEFPEGMPQSLQLRFDTGLFTQEDLDWLLSPDMSTIPRE